MGVAQLQLVCRARGLQLYFARGQGQAAAHALAGLQLLQQFVQPRAGLHRFQHQFDQAAAGQAEAVRGLCVDAVAHHLRHAAGQGACLGLGDQVVFNAAARDAAGDQAVVANGHAGARWTWRRTPGARDGAQRYGVADRAPVTHLPQDLQIDVVHGCSLSRSAPAPSARASPMTCTA